MTQVLVKVGDKVSKDQVLATISSESLDNDLTTARENLQKTKEDLAKLKKENEESRIFDTKQAEITLQTAIAELKNLPAKQKIELESLQQTLKEKTENYENKREKWFGSGTSTISIEEKRKEERNKEKKYLELVRALRADAERLDAILESYDALLHMTDKYEGEGNIYIGAKNQQELDASKAGFWRIKEHVNSLKSGYTILAARPALDLTQEEILKAYEVYPKIAYDLQNWAEINRKMFMNSIENSSSSPELFIDVNKINGRVKEFSDNLLKDYRWADAIEGVQDTFLDIDDTIPAGSSKQEELQKLKRELDQLNLEYQSKVLAQQADTVKMEKAILDAKNNLTEVKTQGAKKKEIETLENQIKEQENALDKMMERYEHYQIIANFDGVVTKVNMQVGDVVSSNANGDNLKYISVETPNLLQINLEIDQIDIVKIQIGMPTLITIDALPGEEFSGTFSEIDTMPEGNIYKAKVVFQKQDEEQKILGGMNANVNVILEEYHDILTIPNPAIAENEEGEPIVRIKRGELWEDQIVEIGVADDLFTEVVSGVEIGDTIKGLYITDEAINSAGIGETEEMY